MSVIVDSQIDSLSVIARQCIAIICFERFCKKFDITHPAISRFIEHVWKIAQVNPETWSLWEAGFSEMPITGLGDPLPQNVLGAVPEKLRPMFDSLVQYVVEVSASTWFGNDLPSTKKYLLAVFEMTAEHGVIPPDLSFFDWHSSSTHSGWGRALTNQELYIWRQLA